MNVVFHKKNIIEYINFISKEESEILLNYFNSDQNSWQLSCFYESYTMDPMAPLTKSHNEVINREYFENLKINLKKNAEMHNKKKLKNLTLSAHKWGTGALARPHSDNSELDGTPNAWQDNKFVTIIYLNDDYEGGNLFFKNDNITIFPKTGTMVAFDPGIENIHEVTEVTKGNRYTVLASWDYEDSFYSTSLKEQKEKEKAAQDEQKKEWKKGNRER